LRWNVSLTSRQKKQQGDQQPEEEAKGAEPDGPSEEEADGIPNLDDLLDGSFSEGATEADSPEVNVSAKKSGNILSNSFSKLRPKKKKEDQTKKAKKSSGGGLRFGYKPKPKPPPVPTTKRVAAPQNKLPPPSKIPPRSPAKKVQVLIEEDAVETRFPLTREKQPSDSARHEALPVNQLQNAKPIKILGLPYKKTPIKTPRRQPTSPARSICSTGTEASIDRIPRSPWRPPPVSEEEDEDEQPICSNPFQPNLHAIRGPCQVCVFRLAPNEKEKFDENGRHLCVNLTLGGCLDCQVFPSKVGEDPVRLCRQCFFNTHRQAEPEQEAFGGTLILGANEIQKLPHGLKVSKG